MVERRLIPFLAPRLEAIEVLLPFTGSQTHTDSVLGLGYQLLQIANHVGHGVAGHLVISQA